MGGQKEQMYKGQHQLEIDVKGETAFQTVPAPSPVVLWSPSQCCGESDSWGYHSRWDSPENETRARCVGGSFVQEAPLLCHSPCTVPVPSVWVMP